MIMNGVDYMALDTPDMLSLFYSMIIDDLVSMGASRQEVREAVDKKLEDIVFSANARMAQEHPQSVAKLEAKPFELTPEMQAAFGLHPPGGD
jgi:hypothetical protein